jgi:hypothetical protein
LDGVNLNFGDGPGDAPRFSEAFSLVIDPPRKRGVRRLPSLYFRYAQLYAARNVEEVLERLEETSSRFLVAEERPLYLLNACELDGRPGLYGRDFFNRSMFRRELSAAGMRFAEDPFVRLNPDGTFSCADWGSLKADFVIQDATAVGGPPIVRMSGATLLYWINGRRLGKLTRGDLRSLAKAFSGLTAVNALEPTDLMIELRRRS